MEVENSRLEIRKKINSLVKQFYELKDETFVPGQTHILTGLAVYDDLELNAIFNSVLDGWFGFSKKGEEFEREWAKYVGTRSSVLVNSGSSANFLALDGVKKLNNLKGGEIITAACSFPTTVNPIIQLGFKPHFLDVDKSLNVNPEEIISAINENTKGIMIAHTLGNPAKIAEIAKIAEERGLFLIEDCCDAVGSTYEGKNCGTFGIASTCSFYPAHNITLGEGGSIAINNPELCKIIKSLRSWGRDCFCRSDEHKELGACNKRFDYLLGGIYYDHRYVYSQIGYNLKPLELQAAMGLEQIKKIDQFNKARKRNYKIYQQELEKFDNYINLPEINPKADPVFFGLPLIVNNPDVSRQDLMKFLNSNKIATRFLFGGNLLNQPAYKNIDYLKTGELDYTNNLFKNCFWLGIHPGVTEEMIKYVISKFKEYFSKC
ncbi:lipopolysaccharide biosynthesis protein RfbH [archaeon]|jgi:CDP-4-dehydro-6-deoxyglucose reductase, E1|nr:lipopolysaccharide biosynthesis protein RfbH [archaeon]MBT4396844.1 lipopolysaccharide biosynthesis protein RfbH [archaeon]MBT4441478.1 lipopolysaccharide biosynthesis protein RfbH [archaeon]